MITRFILMIAALFPAIATAETPRELLTAVAFGTLDRPTSMAATQRVLQSPGTGQEGRLMAAMAMGYRAKLSNSRTDAVSARRAFEVAADAGPNDPEALAALGSWHMSSIAAVGGMMARMVLGARRDVGDRALDRSIALGGNRALFFGNAALLRAKLDGPTADVRRLATLAAAAPAPTRIDQHMKAAAQRILVAFAKDPGDVKALAARLLPLGRFEK